MKTMLFLIVAAATAPAQVVTGTIGGKVSDSSGATARFSFRTKNTGFERNIQTNAEGIYSLPFLPTGRYDVTAEAPGFQPAARRNIDLAARPAPGTRLPVSCSAIPATRSVPIFRERKARETRNGRRSSRTICTWGTSR